MRTTQSFAIIHKILKQENYSNGGIYSSWFAYVRIFLQKKETVAPAKSLYERLGESVAILRIEIQLLTALGGMKTDIVRQ